MWPFGVALWGEASNRLKLRWLKTVVVSVEEKAHDDVSGRDQEDERKRTTEDVSLFDLGGTKTEGPCSLGMSLAGAR